MQPGGGFKKIGVLAEDWRQAPGLSGDTLAYASIVVAAESEEGVRAISSAQAAWLMPQTLGGTVLTCEDTACRLGTSRSQAIPRTKRRRLRWSGAFIGRAEPHLPPCEVAMGVAAAAHAGVST